MRNTHRAIGRDIIERGLDPRVAHTKIGKDGRLVAPTVFDVRPAVLSPSYGDELPTEPAKIIESDPLYRDEEVMNPISADEDFVLEVKNSVPGEPMNLPPLEDRSLEQRIDDDDAVSPVQDGDVSVKTPVASELTDEQILTDHPEWVAELETCKPMVRANKMKKFRRLVRESSAKTE